MVGYTVGIKGAAAGRWLTGTVTGVVSPTVVTVSTAASTTVTHAQGLFGAGGTQVNWCSVDIHVFGRNAAAGSGDVGIKFNCYPQGTGIGDFQNRVRGLVWGVDYGVVFGPQANLNTVEHCDFYKIKTAPIWIDEAAECRVNSGTVSASPNTTLVRIDGGVYNHVSLTGEPGGAKARGCALNPDTINNFLILTDNLVGVSDDEGRQNTIVTHSGGPFPNTRLRTVTGSGALSLPGIADPNRPGTYDVTLIGDVTTVGLDSIGSGLVNEVRLLLRQDAVGGREVVWPETVRWAAESPALDTAAGHMTVVRLASYDSGATWCASVEWAGPI
jgi:hypothetical protein